MYATGEGQTNPPGVDGAVIGRILRSPVLTPTLTIGGQNAQVIYAGSVPDSISGVMQVEALIPANAPTGAAAVVLTIGGNSSQSGATIAVK